MAVSQCIKEITAMAPCTHILIYLSMLFTLCRARLHFTSEPQQITVVRGEDVTFFCAVQGLDSSHVFWSHGDSILSFDGMVYIPSSITNISVQIDDPSVFKLTVHSVRDEHQGDYRCQVTGPQSIIQTHRLTVLVPPQIVFFSPNATQLDVSEHANLQLECRASGRPEPHIVWTRRQSQGHEKDDVDDDNKQVINNDNFVLMASLNRDDTGLYTCNAYNDAGSDTKQVFVNVMYPPRMRNTARWLHVGFGCRAEIVCSFEASSPFDVIWMHNNSVIDAHARPSVNFNVDNGRHLAVLTISKIDLKDVGVYSCVVSNSLDEASHDVLVTGIPFNLTITSEYVSQYSNQYTLQWSVQSLSPIKSYQLWFNHNTTADDNSNDTTASNSVTMLHSSDVITSKSYTISDLEPSTVYAGRLQACNVFGCADWPVFFVFATAEDGRPAPVTTTSTTSTTVTTTSKDPTTETHVPVTTATKVANYRYQQLRTDRGSNHNTSSSQTRCCINFFILLTTITTSLRLLQW